MDLYLVPEESLSPVSRQKKKRTFALLLEDFLGEQKIDVLVSRDQHRRIEQEALDTGVYDRIKEHCEERYYPEASARIGKEFCPTNEQPISTGCFYIEERKEAKGWNGDRVEIAVSKSRTVLPACPRLLGDACADRLEALSYITSPHTKHRFSGFASQVE